MSLAAANPYHLVSVEIANFQVGRFRYPEARPIHCGQNRPVSEILRSLEQRLDLFLAQDDGKLLLAFGQRNPLDLDLAVQGVAVEKAEPADGLNVRRELDSLLVKQKELPRTDLFRPELVGRFVEVFGELGDRADIAFQVDGE